MVTECPVSEISFRCQTVDASAPASISSAEDVFMTLIQPST